MERTVVVKIFVSVVFLVLMVCTPVSAQMEISDLGIIGAAYDINSSGQVVGNKYEPGSSWYYAFLWTPPGEITTLYGGIDSFGFGINDVGQVVGTSYIWSAYADHAVLWENGVMRDLGTLPGGGLSYGYDISTAGTVVGASTTTVGAIFPVLAVTHAFLWTETEGMIDIGSLVSGGDSIARAINDLGHVVGYSSTASGTYHAFLWTQDGGMTDLGTLGGSSSFAWGINNLGQVVGSSSTAEGDSHAFLWTREGGMIDLGTLGEIEAIAADINDFEQIVGSSTTIDGVYHATLWNKDGAITDLGTLPGGSDSGAIGINNLGQIVGYSSSATNGRSATLWMLSQVPPTPQQQTQQMITNVQNLVNTGLLNQGQGNALISMLNALTEQINNGNKGTANILQAFINTVRAYMKIGIFSIAEGQALIDAADTLMNQLG